MYISYSSALFFPPHPVLHKNLHTPSGPHENPPEILPSASRHGLKVTKTKFKSLKRRLFFSFLTIPLQGIPSQSVKGETRNSDEKWSPLFSLDLVVWNPKRSCTVSPRVKAGHEAHFTYINRVIKKKSFKEIKAKQCRSWIFISWTLDQQLTFHPMFHSKGQPQLNYFHPHSPFFASYPHFLPPVHTGWQKGRETRMVYVIGIRLGKLNWVGETDHESVC